MDTLIGAIAAAVLVLPGFVTQELTVRRRPSARADGQTAIQRALFYSVVIQIIWSWDTWQLIRDLTGSHWRHHGAEVTIWLLLVVVLTPVVLGLLINEILLRREIGGRDLTRLHYALGGRDAREAWDYFFQTLDRGAWIVVRLNESTPTAPAMFVGRYGELARHAQSPSAHDVYFDEVWSVDASGRPIERLSHLSGMWLSADQIEAMFPLTDERTDADSPSESEAEPLRIVFSCGRLVLGWGSVRLKGLARSEATQAAETTEVESQTAADPRNLRPAASEADSAADLEPPP